MALYSVYATKADLAAFLFVLEANLPDGSDRLLQRASELIKQSTLDNIDATNTNHMEAVKLAVCAQVEYWSQMGETTAIGGGAVNFSLGDLSMNMGDAKTMGTVSPRAKGYLNDQGLLYRGIGFSRKEAQQI